MSEAVEEYESVCQFDFCEHQIKKMYRERKKTAISIIVPVYNVAAYLRECLDSILSQSFSDFEVICVNDGSTDECGVILDEYKMKDDRIQVISQSNQGLSVARNNGVKHARGRYLIFIDSDDWIDENTLMILYEKMESEQLEVCCFNAVAFGEDEASALRAANINRDYFYRELRENIFVNGKEFLNELIESNQYIATAVTMILLRSYYLQLNTSFYPGIVHEDEPWTFSVLFYANRISCINETLYHYRMRNESITSIKNTFRDAYGYYIGASLVLKTIGTRKELFHNAVEYSGIFSYPLVLQNSAVNCFRQCSMEEKNIRFSLGTEEFAEFERTVVFGEEILDKLIRVEQRLEKEMNTLQSILIEKEKYSAQLNWAQKQLRDIMSSHAYKIGRKMTWLPSKIKRIMASYSLWNNRKK